MITKIDSDSSRFINQGSINKNKGTIMTLGEKSMVSGLAGWDIVRQATYMVGGRFNKNTLSGNQFDTTDQKCPYHLVVIFLLRTKCMESTP